jgi:hypothetical protein
MKPAREVAHGHFMHREPDGGMVSGCVLVVRALASIGQTLEHSVRCDQDTALLEARDAEWRAAPKQGTR